MGDDMTKLLQQWNRWDIQRRRQCLSNITLSLLVMGLIAPITIGIMAAAFESPMIMALGFATGVSIELLMVNVYIWKEWIATL